MSLRPSTIQPDQPLIFKAGADDDMRSVVWARPIAPDIATDAINSVGGALNSFGLSLLGWFFLRGLLLTATCRAAAGAATA